MLNTFEMDTIREIKARAANKQPVANWEKQMLLNLIRREGGFMSKAAIENARKAGFNVEGIQAL
jgi:hypothetical protein